MGGMDPLLLADIERAVRRSWAAHTCAPEGRSRWTPGNPSFGQCGVTAMVLHDLLGGELLRGEVLAGGQHEDYHWWNWLASGVEIDPTREQFGPQQVVSAGVAVAHPGEHVAQAARGVRAAARPGAARPRDQRDQPSRPGPGALRAGYSGQLGSWPVASASSRQACRTHARSTAARTQA